MSPRNCAGLIRRIRAGDQRAAGIPAWMTASAPTTGTIAAQPGNAVSVLYAPAA